MGVASGSSVLKFTLKELEDLVNDSDSQVYLKKDVKYPLKLTPACLQNVNQAITEILTAERLKYIPKYKGLLLAYKHVRRHSNMGTINDDECNILIHIHVDLYIFAPEIGCTMTGTVSKISEDNIGCLVHKGFNVTLPRPRNEGSATWIGNAVRLGDQVRFTLDMFNVVGTLPYIRGVLLSHKAVKRESGLMGFLEDGDMSPKKKQKAAKGRKHALKVEETASESLKKPSKKKKLAEENEGDDLTEESLTKPVKAKKERKTSEKSESAVESASTFSVKKSKKDKKRKSDPIAEPSIELNHQTSTKKKLKLSKSNPGGSGAAGSSASGGRGGFKTSLLQFLQSDDEGDDGKVDLQTEALKATDEEKKKKRKSKSPIKATAKEDLSRDVGDLSIEALMQRALENVSGKTPKPKKSRPLFVPDEKQIPKESPGKKRPENEAVGRPSVASVKKKKPAPENPAEERVGTSTQEELLKSTKKKSKIKKTNLSDSIVISQTPSELINLPKESGLPDFVVPKPEELLAKLQVSTSPTKKLKTKPDKPLDNVETMGTTSKLAENLETSITKKKSRKSSLSESLPEDVVLPEPEEDLLAKLLEQHTKSSKKKKNKANPVEPSVNGEIAQTPSKLAGSPKKIKGKKAVALDEDDEDFNIPTPAEILAKVQEEQRKSPKKKGKTNASDLLDSKEALPTPSKVAAISETVGSKKKRKSKSSLSDSLHEDVTLPKPAELLANLLEATKSPQKKNKSKPTELSDGGDIVQAPAKLAESSESGSSKRKSKSTLLGLLNEAHAPQPPVAKTPAKIRKAFVQSPTVDVARTSKTPKVKKAAAAAALSPLPSLPPLPSLGQLTPRKEEKAGSKRGTPVKSEEGTLSLLDKLLSQEKSMQLAADDSPGLKHSGKKKSKK